MPVGDGGLQGRAKAAAGKTGLGAEGVAAAATASPEVNLPAEGDAHFNPTEG